MNCKRCGADNTVGCFFNIETEENMVDLNMTHPDTVWLCFYGCYPKELRNQYEYDSLKILD